MHPQRKHRNSSGHLYPSIDTFARHTSITIAQPRYEGQEEEEDEEDRIDQMLFEFVDLNANQYQPTPQPSAHLTAKENQPARPLSTHRTTNGFRSARQPSPPPEVSSSARPAPASVAQHVTDSDDIFEDMSSDVPSRPPPFRARNKRRRTLPNFDSTPSQIEPPSQANQEM